MSERKLRVGVVGAGAFAEAAHLPGLQSHPRAEVVALCARDSGAARALADRFGVRDVHTEYRELCARPDLDAVTVCTPNFAHRAVALAALAHGKHVLCEKPLDVSTAGATQIWRAAEQSGRVHQVAFTYRYLHAVEELRRRVRAGDVGEPFHFRAHHEYWDGMRPGARIGWRERLAEAGGGVSYDQGAHFFDLAHFLVGGIEAVKGFTQRLPREREMARTGALAAVDTDDLAAAWLRFASGAAGQWHASRITPSSSENHVVVAGPEGALAATLSRGRVDRLRAAQPGVPGWQELPLPDEARDGQSHAAFRMLRSFVEACLRGEIDRDRDADFGDGLAVQHALTAMEASLDGDWTAVEPASQSPRPL